MRIKMVEGYGFPTGDSVAYGMLPEVGSVRYPTAVYQREVARGLQPNPYAAVNQLGDARFCAGCLGDEPASWAPIPDKKENVGLIIVGLLAGWWLLRRPRGTVTRTLLGLAGLAVEGEHVHDAGNKKYLTRWADDINTAHRIEDAYWNKPGVYFVRVFKEKYGTLGKYRITAHVHTK